MYFQQPAGQFNLGSRSPFQTGLTPQNNAMYGNPPQQGSFQQRGYNQQQASGYPQQSTGYPQQQQSTGYTQQPQHTNYQQQQPSSTHQQYNTNNTQHNNNQQPLYRSDNTPTNHTPIHVPSFSPSKSQPQPISTVIQNKTEQNNSTLPPSRNRLQIEQSNEQQSTLHQQVNLHHIETEMSIIKQKMQDFEVSLNSDKSHSNISEEEVNLLINRVNDSTTLRRNIESMIDFSMSNESRQIREQFTTQFEALKSSVETSMSEIYNHLNSLRSQVETIMAKSSSAQSSRIPQTPNSMNVYDEPILSSDKKMFPNTSSNSFYNNDQNQSPNGRRIEEQSKNDDLILRKQLSQIPQQFLMEIEKLPSDYLRVVCDIESYGYGALRWDNEWTMLHWAAYEGLDVIVEYLLFRGADPHVRETQEGKTPIDLAKSRHHYKTVDVLEKYQTMSNQRKNSSMSPVQRTNEHSARSHHEATPPSYGQPSASPAKKPLPRFDDVPDIYQQALSAVHTYGWNSVQWADGWTALHWASQEGRADIVQFLLNCAADVHAKDVDGHDALYYAKLKGHQDVVRLLTLGAV